MRLGLVEEAVELNCVRCHRMVPHVVVRYPARAGSAPGVHWIPVTHLAPCERVCSLSPAAEALPQCDLHMPGCGRCAP